MSVLPKQPAPVWMVVVTGCGAIILYAVLAALQILVLNPLAAVPGAGLSEIYGGISQAGESPGIPLTLTVLGGGIVLALVLAALLLWNRATTPLAAAMAYLFMLALGAPALFIASFPAGMAVADTFLISGGDNSGWSTALYLFSTVALIAAAALATADAVRRGSVEEKPRGA
ncbi:MAG: hypothetical protein CMH35_10760 [Microbacterium sp.]|nr:hypothetical protein [Microbacterium sp.]